MECKCEAQTPKGKKCHLCMGKICTNKTYRYNGKIYYLVKASLLWSTGNYDGPMCGIALHKGLICYARCYTYYRGKSYWLYALTEKEWIKELKYWSDLNTTNFLSFFNSGGRCPDDSNYIKREPIGFFRLKQKRSPLKSNSVNFRHIEKRCPHLF